MPVILGDNSISVGGKVIETVKSVALLGDPAGTGEPTVTVGGSITPVVLNNDYKYVVFTNTGATQTSYTINFPTSRLCDILVVGGGGGGGYFGGGGGAGGLLFKSSITLASGNYTIKVGKGGVGVGAGNVNGTNGQKSSITISGTEYIADGGGGGGTRNTNTIGVAGNSGGSGGGGATTSGATTAVGGSSTKTTYTYAGWETFGFSGGNGRLGTSGANPNHASGGGGGAGSVGGNISLTTGGGNGGSGKDFISYFGNNVGHNGWFAGGGGGNSYTGGLPGYANGGNGLFGGGGDGGRDGGTELSAQEALPNTGGGGGGSKYDDGSAEDFDGGDGGSGIVIIRFERTKLSVAAQWTYSALNANTYYPGNVGIGIANPTNTLHVIGNTHSSTYSAGKKTFKIEHPLKINKWLYHGCIEGPRFDNIYRGKKLIVEGKCEVDIDAECNTTGGMTPGTFSALNTNYQLYLQNNQTYDVVKGVINGSTISIECENITDEIEVDWLVVGERHDEHVISTPLTDSDGNLICEHDMSGYVNYENTNTNIESDNTPVTNVDITDENITDVNC
jgi:hypothetical protein